MTIEFSLRRRATQARCLAAFWLTLAIIILVGTYISIPLISSETLGAISRISGTNSGPASGVHIWFFAIGTICLGLIAILFACFLLGRIAFVEIELAARFCGLADALCVASNDFDQLEGAASLLVPKAKYLSVPEIFSARDLKALGDLVKQLK